MAKCFLSLAGEKMIELNKDIKIAIAKNAPFVHLYVKIRERNLNSYDCSLKAAMILDGVRYLIKHEFEGYEELSYLEQLKPKENQIRAVDSLLRGLITLTECYPSNYATFVKAHLQYARQDLHLLRLKNKENE